MNKRKGLIILSAVIFLTILILFHPVFAEAQATAEDESTPPEETLQDGIQIASHWSKYAYPESISAGKKVHIIKDGDTLWGLAGEYLGDSYLWPKLWEANQYITNSHWIYPGDPLVIPGVQAVTADGLASAESAAISSEESDSTLYDFSDEDVAGMGEDDGIEFDEDDFIDDVSAIKPVAKYFDITCYETILPEENMFDAHVISSEKKTLNLQVFDYLYIDLGSDQNIKVGDIFVAMHMNAYRPVRHPVSDDFIGWAYTNAGKIKVVMVFGDFSIARVIENCVSIQVGDQIRPFKKLPIPLLDDEKDVTYYEPESANPTGYIVYGQYQHTILGAGDLGVIELGKEHGLELGDLLIVYRDNEIVGLPRIVLGKAVVLVVEESTAVIKILQCRYEIFVGDIIEVM